MPPQIGSPRLVDLDLEDMDLRLLGNVRAPLQADYVRDLEISDIAYLQAHRGTKPPALLRLRDSHHKLAMALADGLSESTAAAICGYSISRVSILRSDPMFSELVAFYRENVSRPETVDLAEVMAAVSVTSATELHERLLDEPEDFTKMELLTISTKYADRTGHGPQSKSLNVNVNVDLAERLASARKRANNPGGGKPTHGGGPATLSHGPATRRGEAGEPAALRPRASRLGNLATRSTEESAPSPPKPLVPEGRS